MSDGSRLPSLAKAAEDATDAFMAAVANHERMEATYLRAWHTAFAQTDESWSDAKRKSTADQASFEERIGEKSAEHMVMLCKAKMTTALAIMSAAQSHLRSIEKQGG